MEKPLPLFDGGWSESRVQEAQAGLELAMTLNSWFFCLHFPSSCHGVPPVHIFLLHKSRHFCYMFNLNNITKSDSVLSNTLMWTREASDLSSKVRSALTMTLTWDH